MNLLDDYDEVWCGDFEFYAPEGHRPDPICAVFKEFRSGRSIRLSEQELRCASKAPFDTSSRVLFVAYYASAEASSFRALGWSLPARVLDLYTEFRCLTNGLSIPAGRGLIGALTYFGLDAMDGSEKDVNRGLAQRGGPYTAAEMRQLIKYCEADVDALASLLRVMAASLTPQALLRGQYMISSAYMEWHGLPVDNHTLSGFIEHWDHIQRVLINKVNRRYDVYDGLTFKRDRFAHWLHERNIEWPLLDSGQLALDEQTFRDMAKRYPEIAPLHELRVTLGQMKRLSISVGPDGRNRCLLSAFGSRSSRNTPSNTRFCFGPATWLRGVIKPMDGMAIASLDYSQQEFAVAASLSGDHKMMAAYRSGDPYLGFAKMAGAVPDSATKRSHPSEREMFKATTLGVQYCMSEYGLSRRLSISLSDARALLALHRKTFSTFWNWSDAAVNVAMMSGRLQSVFGWTLHVTTETKERSLRNFPCQANGAEMLRTACNLAIARGVKVCAPVHDALIIEAPVDCIDDAVIETQKAMAEASEIVLNGFTVETDVTVVRYPDRYMDPRGQVMWDTITGIVEEVAL